MPKAWEGANLAHNLGVFRSLRTAERGTKVSFDEPSGRFSAQGPGVLQTLARTFSSDSVESDHAFAKPVKGLFRVAHDEIGRAVTQADFDAALAGLQALKNAYAGAGDDQRRKRMALDAVIDVIDPIVGEPPEFAEFRDRYRANLLYGVSMSALLRRRDAGICEAMVIDWARRIIGGKGSYAVSKKRSQPFDGTSAPLGGAEQARMLRKVEQRLQPLQAALDQTASVDYRDVRSTVQRFGGKYAELRTSRVRRDDHEHQIDPSATGGAILWDAVTSCASPGVSMISLKGVIHGQRADGHSLGVHRQAARCHFFDPNLGEFSFAAPPAERELFERFATELWRGLYLDKGGTQMFRAWDVMAIS